MVPICWDEISNSPAGTGFTLGIYEEFELHHGKEGAVFHLVFV